MSIQKCETALRCLPASLSPKLHLELRAVAAVAPADHGGRGQDIQTDCCAAAAWQPE